MRRDEETAVSPVIATILMVAITVVLAGVLYVWANNLAAEGTDTSMSTLNSFTAQDAYADTTTATDDTLLRLQMSGKDTLSWTFIKIQLSVGDTVHRCGVGANDACSISQQGGDNGNAWEPAEYVFLSENGVDICDDATCDVAISITYNGVNVAGQPSVLIGGATTAGGTSSGGGTPSGGGSTGGTYQSPFTTHNISTSADSGSSVHAVDLDGDGDMDVLSASWDLIAWYENDGSEVFTTHTITTSARHKPHVYAADVDGDGDMDVLSSSYGTISWYENDGSQSFTSHTISTANTGYGSVHAADVDGDGDMDVLSKSGNYGGMVFWHENDGSESFTDHTISSDSPGSGSVFGMDMDGDGDIDVIASAYNMIRWYENDGSESFTSHNITNGNDGDIWVFPIDLDGDGDIDVLAANGWYLHWYENDGSESFSRLTINSSAYYPASVYAADFDGDGDLDVLAPQSSNAKIVWHENDGSQNFVGHILATTSDSTGSVGGGPVSVFAADVDGDGDIDALSASYGGTVAWYENN